VNNVDYNFQKLTPTDKVELNLYEEALNYVFEQPDTRNVAVSGAYGAGKSSVLKAYKNRHKDKKFIHISLAHFADSEEANVTNGSDKYEVSNSILEGKILNQLIHQIDPQKIPQTNFKVKQNVSTENIIWTTILISLFLISILHINFFASWSAYIQSLPSNWVKTLLAISLKPYSRIVSGMICAGLISFFIAQIAKMQKNRNLFKKLKVEGNEIEIFEESDESYFDKYLNEVLYLFENSDADVIVFEDMDRFNINRVFERLHEINTLVNNQLEKNNKGVLRFFYLLRDDLFISKDRTKIFDFIIPIIQ